MIPEASCVASLPRAHGAALTPGRLRVEPQDFQVEELLGFAPDGEGDHLMLRVRKTGANTEWTARRLAQLAGVPVGAVGYAGLKDRHAVTVQWFSIPRPRGESPIWETLAADGIEILESQPHRRKLKRGALRGNRFVVRVRDLDPIDPRDLAARLELIGARGVPNYFGEQRFGHQSSNLAGAEALFTGTARRVSPHQRGLWLSAARSWIFNALLAERVERGDWDQPSAGDCMQLAGSNAYFLAETSDAALRERCARMDIHPTGPLWGRGEPPSRGLVRALEDEVGARVPTWCEGLAASGLEQERRALRLVATDLEADWIEGDLVLRFALPAGAYATVLLRELVATEI